MIWVTLREARDSPGTSCCCSISWTTESGEVPCRIIRSWLVMIPFTFPDSTTSRWWMLLRIIVSSASKQ